VYMVAGVKRLEPPYEILELRDGEVIWIKPISYQYGEIIIHPRYPGAPPEKVVLAMRIHVEPATKPFFPYYFDVTSRRAVAMLSAIIERAIGEGVWIVVRKHGFAPKAWFTISLEKVKPPEIAAGVPLPA